MPTQAPGQPQQMVLTSEQFLRATKPKVIKVASAQAYTDGGTTTIRMPQSGLGHKIWLIIQASIVVAGTVTSGTLQSYPNPAPFGILKRVRFGNNNAFNMRDLSGWGLYKWLRYRHGFDPLNGGSTANFSSNSTAALGTTGSGRMTPGANIAAGTYTANLALPIPLSYNDAGETGLLVLQQNSTFYDLAIDWGQVSGGIGATGGTNDVFNALVGTGLSVTPSITATVGLEYFEAVPGVDNLISLFMSVSEQVVTPLTTGTNVVRLPVNDYYTHLIAEVINNGAPVAVANIGNVTFQHSGNVIDYQEDYLTNLARQLWGQRIAPMDGCLDWDLGRRRGLLGRRDTLDAFNNMNVTDAQLRFDLPGSLSVTGTNRVTTVMESLRGIRQL